MYAIHVECSTFGSDNSGSGLLVTNVPTTLWNAAAATDGSVLVIFVYHSVFAKAPLGLIVSGSYAQILGVGGKRGRKSSGTAIRF